MRHHAALLAMAISLVSIVSFARIVAAPAVTAGGLPPPRTLRLWMMPPADALGGGACFTNRWHEGKALDWKDTCWVNGSETVYWRHLGADLNSTWDGTSWPGLYAVKSDLTPYDCDGGTVHVGKVKLHSLFGNVIGFVIFAHTDLTSGQFDVYFKNGATKSTAYFDNRSIGVTTNDGKGGSDPFTECWQGWHIHEDNNGSSPNLWESWNQDWTTVPLFTQYANNDRGNWTRRLTFVFQPGE